MVPEAEPQRGRCRYYYWIGFSSGISLFGLLSRMDSMESPASSLARVVVARREQLAFRVGLAIAAAVVSQTLTGWQTALVWVAVYTAVQVGEHRAFFDVSTAADLTPGRTRAV